MAVTHRIFEKMELTILLYGCNKSLTNLLYGRGPPNFIDNYTLQLYKSLTNFPYSFNSIDKCTVWLSSIIDKCLVRP